MGRTSSTPGGPHFIHPWRAALHPPLAGRTSSTHGGPHFIHPWRAALHPPMAGRTSSTPGGPHFIHPWRAALHPPLAGRTSSTPGGPHFTHPWRAALHPPLAGRTSPTPGGPHFIHPCSKTSMLKEGRLAVLLIAGLPQSQYRVGLDWSLSLPLSQHSHRLSRLFALYSMVNEASSEDNSTVASRQLCQCLLDVLVVVIRSCCQEIMFWIC